MRAHEILSEMRPDSDEFHNLDPADQWLARYTYENLDRWPGQEILDILVRRYPVSEPRRVYRGMNFSTKEKWDEFAENIRGGKLTLNGISSWGPNAEQVEQFAVTKPSYYLNLDTMAEYGKAREQREYISGYRGVIISTMAEPGQAIDVTVSRLGHEGEIILTPGTYPIEVYRDLKLYRDALQDGDTTIDDAILNPKGQGKYDNGLRDYILHHHVGRLGPEARRHLFRERRGEAEKYGPITAISPHVIEPSSFDQEGTKTRATLSTHYSYFEAGMRGEYLPEDDAIARKEAGVVTRKVIRYIQQHPDYLFLYTSELTKIAEYAGLSEEFFHTMKSHIGAQYRALETAGREINKRKFADQWEADAAMRRHGQRAAEILGQLPRG